MNDLKPILESLLFVAEEPLTVDKFNNVLELADKSEIRTALEELREILDNREGGFHLREVAGGWQLRTRPEHHEWIKRMLQPSPQRLSRAALETLAIVAYKQPVIRADIEFIRGVDSGGVLRQLMERKLIRVLGRKEIPGRPLIYATTKLFLELFDLKDLKDLPSPKEIEELSSSSHNETDTQAISDDMENEKDIDTETSVEASNEEISEESSETTPAEKETDYLENDESAGTADPAEKDTISIPPTEPSELANKPAESDPEMDSEQGVEPVEHYDSNIPDSPVHYAYVLSSSSHDETDTQAISDDMENGNDIDTETSVKASNEEISDENAEATRAENATDSLENDENASMADPAQKDPVSIPPTEPSELANKPAESDPQKDYEQNPELVARNDSEIPDFPVRHAYVVTTPGDNHADPSKDDEIDPAENNSISITSTESSAPARERTGPDPQKDSEQSTKLVAQDDSDRPDSSAHSKEDSNNLLS